MDRRRCSGHLNREVPNDEEVLFSVAPPRIIDFLDDALVIEYHRSPLIKTLRITVEETYTFQGESL